MASSTGVLLLLVLFIGAIVALHVGGLAAFFFFLSSQTKERKRIAERALAAHSELVSGRQWFPVRYASESRFQTMFKIFPWEAVGILVTAPGSAVFLGESDSGAPVRLDFDLSVSAPSWIGRAFWPNGALSFFCLSAQYQKHYFTSETGTWVLGSEASTKIIYDAVAAFAGARWPTG